MAFISEDLSLLVQPIGGTGMRWFGYRTDDSQATLEAADYIPNATRYGVRADDLVFVSQKTGGVDPYIMVVSEIDALDNATLVLGDPLEFGTAAAADILDEDDFASDSADDVPSQQSVKAYVDFRVFDTYIDARARHGVVGGGAVDDSAAVLAALTAAATEGASVVFPEMCRLDSLVDLDASSAPFKILSGSFLVNNSTGGILLEPSSIHHDIYIGPVKFLAGISTSGRPLEVNFPTPSPASHRNRTLFLDGVRCEGAVYNDGNYRWSAGVKARNAWHARVDGFHFNGGANGNVSVPGALWLTGYSINANVLNSYASNVDDGFIVDEDSEGVKFLFTNCVTANNGFIVDAGEVDLNPQAMFICCHTNVSERGIYSRGYSTVSITGHEFYRLNTVAGYKDVELIRGHSHIITGNKAFLGAGVENWFVHATDVDGLIVKDNVMSERWHHVQIEGTSKNVIASNNIQDVLVAGSYADELVNNASGTGNKLLHWKAENWHSVTLNAGSTSNDIATATATAITWNTTPNYNDQVGFASGSPTRITPPNWVSSVELSAVVEFASDATGYRLVLIRKNGSTVVSRVSVPAVNGLATYVAVPPIRVANSPGDYYEVVVTQNSGSTLSVAAATTRFECRPVS